MPCEIIKCGLKKPFNHRLFSNQNEKQEEKVKITGTLQNNTAGALIIITELNTIPKMKT